MASSCNRRLEVCQKSYYAVSVITLKSYVIEALT